MFWYLFICALMLYPWMIHRGGLRTGKKTEYLALGIACTMLWFFMALRNVTVGVDTQYYCYVFTQFEDIPLHKVFTAVTYATESQTWEFDFEPGYRLVNKLASLLGSHPQIITVVNSTIIMVLLYRLIRNQSPMVLVSVWLYITLGVYQTEMNVTRNAIAILIIYNACVFMERREMWKYILCCVAGAMFHVTALVFIPLYWVYHRVALTPKRCVTVVLCFVLLGASFPVLGPYIQNVVPSALAEYFEGDVDSLSSLLVGVLNAMVFFVVYFMMERKERSLLYTEHKFGMMMFVLNLCFFGLNIGLADAARMAGLFGAYMMILIPRMLQRVSRHRRGLAVLLVVLFCGAQYVLRLCINNIGGTMPYEFFA